MRPAARYVGRPTRAKLLFEPLGVGARGEQEHDLPGGRVPGVDELPDAPGDVARLRPAPVDPGFARRRLVGDEKLDSVPQRRRDVGRRLERLELVAELCLEQLVHRGEHLRPRAVVLRQRQHGRRDRATLAEHRDVGVAEPVDRLELVADDEQVTLGAGGEEVEELRLEAVRVLELVDHHRAEPLALALPDRGHVSQQVARTQLEVLEVERRLGVLRLGVRLCERHQQFLKQFTVPGGELFERRRHEASRASVKPAARGPRAFMSVRARSRSGSRVESRRSTAADAAPR